MLNTQEKEFLHSLVEMYGSILEKYCWRCLAASHDREQLTKDILQDVYLDAIQNVKVLMDHPKVLGWLKLSCYHHIIDARRSQNSKPECLLEPEQIDKHLAQMEAVDALKRWKEQTLSDVCSNIIEILSSEERNTFEDHFLKGYTMKETAERENLDYATVRGRINSIRKKLKKFYSGLCILVVLIRFIK